MIKGLEMKLAELELKKDTMVKNQGTLSEEENKLVIQMEQLIESLRAQIKIIAGKD